MSLAVGPLFCRLELVLIYITVLSVGVMKACPADFNYEIIGVYFSGAER